MLDEHLGYVTDSIRLERFRAAIGKTMPSGAIVADLGCGSGVLGLLCFQAGATRVYAIDCTEILELARGMFLRAGLGERANLVRGHSQHVVLPEPVNLVICDHVGHFGFDYGIAHTLQDARRRFLAPDGRMIPERIRMRLAAVESEACRSKVDAWCAPTILPQFHWVRRHSVNRKHAVELPRDSLLGEPVVLGEIDLREDDSNYFRWSAMLRIARDGVMHGLAGWFECELASGVWMTNSPTADDAIDRSQAFLPIEEPVSVKAGDIVAATIMARPQDNVLAWVVECQGRRFSHSTWQGSVWSREESARSRPDRVPRLSPEGRARSTVLEYCDGRRTAREIESEVQRDHPDLLPSPDEIARFVAHVLARDTE